MKRGRIIERKLSPVREVYIRIGPDGTFDIGVPNHKKQGLHKHWKGMKRDEIIALFEVLCEARNADLL